MSRRAWLTPDDAPGADVCVQVFIPGGRDYLAAFRGAFLLLCEAFNWETHGSQSPQTVADAFMSAFFHIQDEGGQCALVHYVGEIFLFGGSSDPPGCLKCEGQFILRADYPELFAAIGDTFGSSDTSDFRLPDLRGRLPIGVTDGGNGLGPYAMGDTGGKERHGLVLEEMPQHRHSFQRMATLAGSIAAVHYTGSAGTLATEFTTDQGQGLSHENRPPYQALQFYIQAE